MATSILAGGRQVPARPVVAPPATPAAEPAKPIEIAAPAWLQPILDRLAAADEKEDAAAEQYDDGPLRAAIEKLQKEQGPITKALAEVTRQKEEIAGLKALVAQLQAQLAKPQPPATLTGMTFTGVEIQRGGDGLTRYLKLVKE